MICSPCREAADRGTDHAGCVGGTFCDCQHQPPRLLFVPYVGDPDAPTVRELAAGIVIGEGT